MEETEEPFFTKSKEKFTTSTIEAWGMLRRHYIALKGLSARDMPDRKYKKLWDYENYLVRTIKYLEEIPALLVVREDENRLPLDGALNCEPIKYDTSCKTIETTEEETVGTYLSSMRQS
jgi:hypothetical protein